MEEPMQSTEEKIQDGEIVLPENEKDKKIKNLFSVVILLAGLFLGSLFVDMIQLVSGSGFSSRLLKGASVVESNGKTWVAYDQPVIGVKVFSRESCTACKTDEVLVWLRRVIPTVAAEKVDVSTEAGKALAEKYGIASIPGFVFTTDVEKTDLYSKAQSVFEKVEDGYVLSNSEIGIPTGEYLSSPKVEEQDAVVGNLDAPVKLVEFSDFQCPYCKLLHESIKQIVQEMGDKVVLVYKHLPLDIHPQAENAALAAACANEQGKFWDYSNKLFSAQSEWGRTAGTARFKSYAVQLKLDAAQFNKCLDDKKYADLIKANMAEADRYSISGTPAIFINNQFRNGAVKLEDLRALINEELEK